MEPWNKLTDILRDTYTVGQIYSIIYLLNHQMFSKHTL